MEVYNDKIYPKLKDNKIRDKILIENLERIDYDNENVYKFLSLLKKLLYKQLTF